jgi:Transposase
MEAMAKHRTHSIEFKRQVAQDFIAGETLHALASRHDISRNLIRIWVRKFEAMVVEHDDPRDKGRLRIPSEAPFRENKRSGSGIDWWNVTPSGKWVEDFAAGRRHALKFWKVCGSGRAFALEFQQIILGMLTAAKSPTGPPATRT